MPRQRTLPVHLCANWRCSASCAADLPSCSYIVGTALKRVDTVEIAEFVEGDAEDGIYDLHYDDAVTTPEALIATVTSVGYGAALADGSGS